MARFFKSVVLLGALTALLFVLYASRGVLTEALAKLGDSLKNAARDRESERKMLELEAKNQELKTELSLIKERARLTGTERYRFKAAEVYSRYPFNDQSVVFINLGSEDGIREDMAVFASPGVLLGKVKKVGRTQSEVETIFSAMWKTSVAVGEEKVKAVYVGGAIPKLDFIPKEAKIKSGDKIVNLSPDVPLGVLLGEVSEASVASYEVWQNAEVTPLFSPESFSMVFVLVDFP